MMGSEVTPLRSRSVSASALRGPRWRLALLVALIGLAGCRHSPDRHLNQGDALLGQGNAESALAEYLEALRLEPSLRAERGVGLAYAALGSLERAEQHLTLALSVQPGDTQTRLALIKLYGTSGRDDDARKQLAILLEDQPGHVGALLLAGGYAATSADVRQAVLGLERVVEREKARGATIDRELLILLAELYAREGQSELAKRFEAKARLATLGGELQTLELGRVCVQQKRFALAHELLRAVLDKRPSDPDALTLLASAALELGRISEAKAALAQLPEALKTQPEARLLGARLDLASDFQVEASRELTSLLAVAQAVQPTLLPSVRMALAEAWAAQARPAEAKSELEHLIAESPERLGARVRMARLELDRGHPELSVQILTPLPAEHPELGSAYDILGRAELARGNAEAAESSFRQVVTLTPDRPEGRYGVARALLLRGKAALARPLLEDNVARFAAHRPSLWALGELLRRSEGQREADNFMMKYWVTHVASPEVSTLEGDWEYAHERPTRALAAYRRAITLQADYYPAAAALGRFYARRKLAEQAFSVLDGALALSPADLKLLLLSAEVASDLRSWARAREHLDRVFALTPDCPAGLAQLGRLIAESGGDLARARELAERAFASAPGNADVIAVLGWVHHLSGNDDEARRQLEAAVRLDADNPQSHYRLAVVAAAQGATERAAQSLAQALEIDPAYPDSSELRGRLPRVERALGPAQSLRRRPW
jgi:tetratricopeptide (TPR) repeat protein